MKIIKVGALWCPGCLVMQSRFKKLEQELGNLNIISYDYDQDPDIVLKYNIGKILPVIIIVDDDDQEITRLIGEQSVKKLISVITESR